MESMPQLRSMAVIVGWGPGRLRFVAVPILLGACGPEQAEDGDEIAQRYASVRCGKLEACDCESNTHLDEAECEADVLALYGEVVAATAIDVDCLRSAVNRWNTLECSEIDRTPSCDLIAEPLGVGAECRRLYHAFHDPIIVTDYCGEGLLCWEGRCVERSPELSVGDPCTPDGQCGSGDVVCIDGMCDVRRDDGDPCSDNAHCRKPVNGRSEEFLFCIGGRCGPGQVEGAECDENTPCAGSSVHCLRGTCTTVSVPMCNYADFPI